MPPPQKCILVSLRPWSLVFDPWKPFQQCPLTYVKICGKFRWNPSTNYRDLASRELDINGQQTDGQTTRKHNALSAYYCRRRHINAVRKSHISYPSSMIQVMLTIQHSSVIGWYLCAPVDVIDDAPTHRAQTSNCNSVVNKNICRVAMWFNYEMFRLNKFRESYTILWSTREIGPAKWYNIYR